MVSQRGKSIDRNSPVPLHYQLKQILLRQVQEEYTELGQPFPSEKVLQEKYNVSRITVRRALSELVSAGFLTRQPGRGTFAVPPKFQNRSLKLGGLIDDLAAQGHNVKLQVLRCEMVLAPPKIADKLGKGAGCAVLYLERIISADDEPIAIAKGYFDVGENVVTREELGDSSIYPVLEDKCGIVFHRATKTIEPTVALEEEAALLHTKPNALMLLVESTVYNNHNRPVALVKSLYRGDRYKYFVTVTP